MYCIQVPTNLLLLIGRDPLSPRRTTNDVLGVAVFTPRQAGSFRGIIVSSPGYFSEQQRWRKRFGMVRGSFPPRVWRDHGAVETFENLWCWDVTLFSPETTTGGGTTAVIHRNGTVGINIYCPLVLAANLLSPIERGLLALRTQAYRAPRIQVSTPCTAVSSGVITDFVPGSSGMSSCRRRFRYGNETLSSPAPAEPWRCRAGRLAPTVFPEGQPSPDSRRHLIGPGRARGPP